MPWLHFSKFFPIVIQLLLWFLLLVLQVGDDWGGRLCSRCSEVPQLRGQEQSCAHTKCKNTLWMLTLAWPAALAGFTQLFHFCLLQDFQCKNSLQAILLPGWKADHGSEVLQPLSVIFNTISKLCELLPGQKLFAFQPWKCKVGGRTELWKNYQQCRCTAIKPVQTDRVLFQFRWHCSFFFIWQNTLRTHFLSLTNF